MIGGTAKQFVSILLAVALFLGSIVIIATLDQPAVSDVVQARADRDDAQKVFETQKQLINSAKATLQQYEDLGKMTERFGFVLPISAEYGELTNNVLGLAGANGLKAGSMTFTQGDISSPPQPDIPTKGFGTMTVNLALEGPYAGFRSFIEKLETNSRLLDVKEVQVSQQGDTLHYQLTLLVYYQS
ncbi:MAG: hypothetical protein HZA35_04240 [Parcubacteria group bacterium]|nr:hypothetical protein [Parcubacteria group bacterium]